MRTIALRCEQYTQQLKVERYRLVDAIQKITSLRKLVDRLESDPSNRLAASEALERQRRLELLVAKKQERIHKLDLDHSKLQLSIQMMRQDKEYLTEQLEQANQRLVSTMKKQGTRSKTHLASPKSSSSSTPTINTVTSTSATPVKLNPFDTFGPVDLVLVSFN